MTAVCRYSRTGEGLHRFVDPADGRTYLYTQFEASDARRVFACFEQPDLKARFAIVGARSRRLDRGRPTARAQTGRRRSTADLPLASSPRPAADLHLPDRRWWPATTPRSPARYAGARAARCRCPSCAASPWLAHLDADRIFAITQAGSRSSRSSSTYPYPFGKYDQVFVPEYNGGAMENVGCVTLRDDYLFREPGDRRPPTSPGDNTILHELSHMWFGDLVTMRWWDDLWLKESFAELGLALRRQPDRRDPELPWATFCNSPKTWAYRQTSCPSTHPVAADMVDLEAVEHNFDRITYAKGASVLRQLVAFVGLDAVPRRGPALLRRATRTATPRWPTCCAASRRPPDGTCPAGRRSGWRRPGSTPCGCEFDTDTDGRVIAPPTRRADRPGRPPDAAPPPGRARPRTTSRAAALRAHPADRDGRHRRPERRSPSSSVGLEPDPLWSTTTTSPTPRSGSTTVARCGRSSICRTIAEPARPGRLWGALWDTCRDARAAGRRLRRPGAARRRGETERDRRPHAARPGRVAAYSYTPGPPGAESPQRWRAGLAACWTGRAGFGPPAGPGRTFASRADPGWSGRAGRRLAGGRTGARGTALSTPICAGCLSPHWPGSAGSDEAGIAAEEQRDSSITGAEQAAGARAARPTAEAKADAWRLAVESRTT